MFGSHIGKRGTGEGGVGMIGKEQERKGGRDEDREVEGKGVVERRKG